MNRVLRVLVLSLGYGLAGPVSAGPIAADLPQEARLSRAPVGGIGGLWEGRYAYSDGRAPVPFLLSLRLDGDRSVKGRVYEPNTFGDAQAAFLYAHVSGEFDGRVLRFRKTYDGTGGQRHSVQYQGRVDPQTRRINGEWDINGLRGHFEATFRE